MNLDELRRIRETERSTDSVQELRDSFYREVSSYLGELRRERDVAAERAADPFDDPNVRQLSDELDAAERTVEAVYERRVGKIVKLASFAAADMSASRDGLTNEERELFDEIVSAIKSNRTGVLDILAEDESATPEHHEEQNDSSDEDVLRGETDGDTQAVPTNADQESTESTQPDSVDRTTVRITEDVGTIMGIDSREYVLDADDVVSLPTKNATPLLDRGAAEQIK